MGFNVELGGYFSIKRNARSIPGDTWLDVEEVAPYCKAILEVFRSVLCSFRFWQDACFWQNRYFLCCSVVTATPFWKPLGQSCLSTRNASPQVCLQSQSGKASRSDPSIPHAMLSPKSLILMCTRFLYWCTAIFSFVWDLAQNVPSPAWQRTRSICSD